MTINKLHLKFFGLIKEATIYSSALNIITGQNFDVTTPTGNSIGKSTVQNAITFAIYGEVTGINLSDLIHFGCVSSEVEIEIDNLKIKRKIPNKLEIWEDNIKLDFNTSSIAQDYLNKRYGSLEQFKKFRCVDIGKGIDLLSYCADSRSILTLRKELMSFIDDYFSSIRKSLLEKKLNCETYSIDKRLYKFSLSQKRLTILDNGLKELENKLKDTKNDWLTQNESVNQIKGELQSITSIVDNLYKQIAQIETNVSENDIIISDYKLKIETLKNQPKQVIPEIINYDDLLKQQDNEIQLKTKEIALLDDEINKITESVNTINQTITSYSSDIKNYKKEKNQIQSNIVEVGLAKSGVKCNKCGSPITEENKEGYILDEGKKLEEIDKSLTTLATMVDEQTNKVLKHKKELETKLTEKNKLESDIKIIRNECNDLNKKKFTQEHEINRIKNLEIIKEAEIKKYNELINTYIKQNEDYSFQLVDINVNLKKQTEESKELESRLINEEADLKNAYSIVESVETKLKMTESYLLKLKEAFKFSDYKFTLKDVLLYTESIKVLDLFASSYIKDYLQQLSIIMNDLMKPLNITIDFVDSKEFIEIKENNQKLKYTQLSSAQKTFLGICFKISILLQKGETEGILLIDEGLNNLHKVNFINLLEILKGLNFQVFCIYQNLPEIKDVKIINLIRKNGITEVR
jgi:DNA repair exonuclease SbcCD ATPase subunit